MRPCGERDMENTRVCMFVYVREFVLFFYMKMINLATRDNIMFYQVYSCGVKQMSKYR